MATPNTKYLAQEKARPLVPTTSPKPTTLDATEVMIRVQAAAMNPVDWKMVGKGLRVASWPFVPGLDGAGIIEAVGDEVHNFSAGDEVLGMFVSEKHGGSFQKFAVVPAMMVARKPSSWSFEEAASLGVCYFTAVVALGIGLKTPLPFLQDGPTTGVEPSSVLVLGGSSSLGAALVQLLRLAVPDCVIIGTSSPRNHDRILALGANAAFDRNSASLVTDVKSATADSRGVDAIIDAVGAGSTERHVFETLDPNGHKRYAQVWTGDDEIQAPAGVESVMFRGNDAFQLQGGRNIMASLQKLLAEDKYKLPLPVRKVGQGLNGLEKGLELLRKGVSGEKLAVGLYA